VSDQAATSWQYLLADNELVDSAMYVLAGSNYVAQWGERYPERAAELIASGDLLRVYKVDSYVSQLASRLTDVADETTLNQQLRYFRQREMVRIIWRDLAGWANLAETVRELSALADACIQQSLTILHSWLAADFGEPYNVQGEGQQLVVLAMGKLGAGELNLSSDVDLIFTYLEDGETQGGRRSLSHQEFFTRLGQKLIQSLDNVTIDGFVFRVDMRLRPFGDSGALVASFAAMEDYYQTQGREWERYAMIKVRAVTGSTPAKKALLSLLQPFVYRRYLDYGVFDALREMKSMVAGQLDREGLEDNIKLGDGGIREIEFIGQVFQLIYGGRDKSLQQRPILTVLDILAERNCLSAYVVTDLKAAYDFLRRTEHRIQAWADKQTHLLPKDEAGQMRIASLMGFDYWHSFEIELVRHRKLVKSHFEQLLTSPQADQVPAQTISLFNSSDKETLRYLQQLGFADPEACLAALTDLLNNHVCRNLSITGRDRLQKLLPLLVQASANMNNADDCLSRLIPLIDSIMRRSAYMALLVENPLALSQLVKLCAASPWISSQLTRFPVLLDELLDPRSLYAVPNRQEQSALLTRTLSTVKEGDLERQMDLLREFRQAATLHVAAADITDALTLVLVGDQLSELAEIQLEQVFKLAWAHLVTRHGRPPCTNSDDINQSGFSILAYGKLGGIELGYGSDLDLVFIYDDTRSRGNTDGLKSIDALLFYIRLAQRIITILNTVTSSGILYEIDMRLRPNGNSGLLVTSVSGFAEYQTDDAWTWEHQALVRTRCVAGDTLLAQKVSDIRQQVLAKQCDQQLLAVDVVDMRAKMRSQLDKSKKQTFDLKQGIGGITDIEFMVQYAVLAWSTNWPELLVYTDNIRIIKALVATGKLSEQDGALLTNAYRFYRKLANHCVLQEKPTVVTITEVEQYQPRVKALWARWFAET
jgi:glutamate-ammonia-ligase adenylyltransferase